MKNIMACALVVATMFCSCTTALRAFDASHEELASDALRGSGVAGYDLWYKHSVQDENPREGLFWLRLSAENGYCPAIIEMTFELTYLYPSFRDARLWLNRYEELSCDRRDSKYARREKLFAIWSDKDKLLTQQKNSRSWIYAGVVVE